MIATIRATDHKDLPALSKFLVRVYKFEPSDFHFDPRLLEWKYLYPRAGWQGGRSYLFERGGEIVAHGGICPVSFRLPTGRTVSGHVIVDWAADSRTPGVGVMMYRKLMQTASTSFAIGGEPDTRKPLIKIGGAVVVTSDTGMKRDKPFCVPNQRAPLWSRKAAFIAPPGKPSAVVKCLMRLVSGSSWSRPRPVAT